MPFLQFTKILTVAVGYFLLKFPSERGVFETKGFRYDYLLSFPSYKYLNTPMISEYTGNFLGSLKLGTAGKLISGSNSSPDDLVLLFVLTDAMLFIQSKSCSELELL